MKELLDTLKWKWHWLWTPNKVWVDSTGTHPGAFKSLAEAIKYTEGEATYIVSSDHVENSDG